MAKFETNLSNKDKMTIAIILFVGVMFCFAWYLIKPAVADIRSLSDKIEQAEITQAQYRGKIMNLSSSEAVFGRALTDLGESTAEFYEIMPSSTIDRMVTNYVLSFGLFPEDLYITMPSGPVDEIPYVYSEAMVSQTRAEIEAASTPTPTPASSGDSTSEDNQTAVVDGLFVPYNQAKIEARSTSSSGVVCADITIVVTGDEATCQALINDISTQPSFRVRGFEWLSIDPVQVFNEETRQYEFIIPDYSRLSVDLRLYMVNVADYDALVSEAVETAEAEG